MKEANYCPHCYPAYANHKQEKIDSMLDFYFAAPLGRAFTTIFPQALFRRTGKVILRAVLSFSQFIQHAQLTDVLDRSQLNNGILVIWDEAKRRGLEIFNITFGNKHTQH